MNPTGDDSCPVCGVVPIEPITARPPSGAEIRAAARSIESVGGETVMNGTARSSPATLRHVVACDVQEAADRSRACEIAKRT